MLSNITYSLWEEVCSLRTGHLWKVDTWNSLHLHYWLKKKKKTIKHWAIQESRTLTIVVLLHLSSPFASLFFFHLHLSAAHDLTCQPLVYWPFTNKTQSQNRHTFATRGSWEKCRLNTFTQYKLNLRPRLTHYSADAPLVRMQIANRAPAFTARRPPWLMGHVNSVES